MDFRDIIIHTNSAEEKAEAIQYFTANGLSIIAVRADSFERYPYVYADGELVGATSNLRQAKLDGRMVLEFSDLFESKLDLMPIDELL